MKAEFITEGGLLAIIRYGIVKDDDEDQRVYGISALMTVNGKTEEEEVVRCRFFTLKEAEMTIKMLCKYKVTPCTLKDIL